MNATREVELKMATVIKKERRERSPPRTDALIGELLQRAGRLTEQDIGKVVVVQQELGLRFGEAALQLGLVKEDDVHRALSRQFDYSYVDVGESNLDHSLYAAYEPFGAQSEALRKLRTQLKLRWFTDRRKTLTIVAARAGEGCSSVAANLAIAFSQTGERTLLVDANLRAPSQHKLFGVPMADGLCNLLGGRGSLSQAIMSVPAFPHLSLLGAGGSVPNPQELLSRLSFAYLMETFPATFDVVIVDSPPALDYGDCQLIAAHAGGCLMATRQHKTRVADIEKVKQQLQASGAVLLGAVITKA
jgi:chain length determinant protein tyrosine kinase EpsG